MFNTLIISSQLNLLQIIFNFTRRNFYLNCQRNFPVNQSGTTPNASNISKSGSQNVF